MKQLTQNQQYVINALNHRGAFGAANDFEVAWKLGKEHQLDARNGCRRGLVRAIDQGNKEALCSSR